MSDPQEVLSIQYGSGAVRRGIRFESADSLHQPSWGLVGVTNGWSESKMSESVYKIPKDHGREQRWRLK